MSNLPQNLGGQFRLELGGQFAPKLMVNLDWKVVVNLTVFSNKIKDSIDFFGIKEIYETCHTDLIQKIIHKKIAFSDRYIKELENTYNLSFDDAYSILFETHHKEILLHKKPFSKLKKDIFDDVNIKSS